MTEGPLGGTKVEYEYRYSTGTMLNSRTVRPAAASGDRVTTLHYTYDGLERVRSMGFSQSSPDVELTYNDRNQYDTISFGNGMERSHTYDAWGG
jgi:hypothetical protein